MRIDRHARPDLNASNSLDQASRYSDYTEICERFDPCQYIQHSLT
jgi:hypothetical protein